MTRTLSPMLRRCLERANPNVATFVEISAPDQARVLRRAEDQLLATAFTPALGAVATPSGAITLASEGHELISQFVDGGWFNIPMAEPERYFNSVAWRLDPAFEGGVLRAVTVRVKFLTGGPDLTLQIFKATRTAGSFRRLEGSSLVVTEGVQHAFTPLLHRPATVRYNDLTAVLEPDGFATVTFDLSAHRLAIEPLSGTPPGPGESGELPELYFVLQTTQTAAGNFVEWRRDLTSPISIAGVGQVREASWNRPHPEDPRAEWVQNVSSHALMFKLEIDAFVESATGVYPVTLPAAPNDESTGRVVFLRGSPRGASATLELSVSGAGGPFVPVTNGELVPAVQQTYHARLTMTASADGRRAPIVSALGVEFRRRVDLSAEASIEPMGHDVALPFLAANIAEGRATIVRTGRRDYHDPGTELAARGVDTQLEADFFLGSRHPGVTRDDWFHTARALVSSRQPTPTAEIFSLLSLTKTLKRKIPAQVETISSVHHVAADATLTQVPVTTDLPGTTAIGNEYGLQGYYVRVRASAVVGLEPGTTFTILGNLGVDTLEFAEDELPAAFAPGDIIEVHSARFAEPAITWIDQDPADVWWDILTTHLEVPEDRIGFGDGGGRSGLPPRVTDRAPDDEELQACLLVTLKLTAAEEADALLDQLSFIMGGATVEVAGQIVFRQLYALRDREGWPEQLGRVTIPLPPAAAIFDRRDIVAGSLETPTGREERITVLACDYGADTTAAETQPVSTQQFVDVDALAALGLQDVEGMGTAKVPSAISRWCYNSGDSGLTLAAMVSQQVILVASTGLRVWSFSTIDAHPELMIGDTVIVVTDQFTDFDPAREVAIRGWNAYPLTLVGVASGGKSFRGLLPGLAGVIPADVRGGRGTLQDHRPPRIVRLWYEDAETTRTFHLRVLPSVVVVWVFDNLVAVGGTDPYNADELPTTVLTPDPVTYEVEYVVEKPPQGYQKLVHFVPRDANGVAGDVDHVEIDPAPSGLAGSIKAEVTDDTADLTLRIEGTAPNWPVTATLYEDNPDGTPIFVTVVNAPTTITSDDEPVLADRPLPPRESRRWFMKLTDVAGLTAWGVSGGVDRNALASGTVTLRDYQASPDMIVPYDDDTDAVRFTLPDDRTLTIDDLSGSGVLQYSVGDVLDDLSLEEALLVDEVRTPYRVEVRGGGTWTTIFLGPLHGASSKPPTIQPHFTLSADRDRADVYARVNTPSSETLRLFVRDSESVGAPEYGLCAGEFDDTPRYVASGTVLGPTDWFTDGSAQVLALADIALLRDQIKRLYLTVQGKDSGVQNSAVLVVSAMEQPWLESIAATWNDTAGTYDVTLKGGAHCESALIEIDDDPSFPSPYTHSGALADGGSLAHAFALSAGERGKVWYARGTPNNAPLLAGLPGVPQQDSDFIGVLVPTIDVTSTSFADRIEFAITSSDDIYARQDSGSFTLLGASPQTYVVYKNAAGGLDIVVQIEPRDAAGNVGKTLTFTVPPIDGTGTTYTPWGVTAVSFSHNDVTNELTINWTENAAGTPTSIEVWGNDGVGGPNSLVLLDTVSAVPGPATNACTYPSSLDLNSGGSPTDFYFQLRAVAGFNYVGQSTLLLDSYFTV